MDRERREIKRESEEDRKTEMRERGSDVQARVKG